MEYQRWSQRFASEAAQELTSRLVAKSRIIWPRADSLRAVLPYFQPPAGADALHAAACLEANAVLISNDTDFRAVAQSGLVVVWSITEALRRLAPGRR